MCLSSIAVYHLRKDGLTQPKWMICTDTSKGFRSLSLAIILCNVTSSGILTYAHFSSLACPEEESLLTILSKTPVWEKAPFKNPALKTRKNTRKQRSKNTEN